MQLEKDIYSENGILLLSKGQIVDDDVIEKLKRHGINIYEKTLQYDTTTNNNTLNISQNETLTDKAIQTFAERKHIRNLSLLERPNTILRSIIFEAKSRPWVIYSNALANYVGWIYTHSIDVAIISLMIAVELRFNDKELWDIGLGALLHDVGKLLIPRSVIQKPGPLTDIEMLQIQQHCELGVSTIEPLYLPKECTDVILQHHERLDGSGYPLGLKGDEICRNAQIVMVADAFDAITSERPYRHGWDIEEIGKILKGDEGKFSSEIISVLEKILM